jgi:ATP-dependent RNA helicase RhlB
MSQSQQHLTDTRMDSLGLAPPLVQALHELGFERCTPIQAQALPLALAGQDVAGQAQTGTGKTAAFLLASFQRLLAHPAPPERKPTSPRVLCIAPTRELAVQIHKDAEALGKHTGLKLAVVYGGAGYDTQRQTLQAGVDVLIGTPGRLIDYFKQHVYDLRFIEVAILDEADRMFDLGFIKDIRFLLRRMPHPEKRLNLLFSATLSHRVLELAYEHMNSPRLVKIESDKVTADRVRQVLYHVSMEDKIPLLLGLLRKIDPTRTLVFVNTKRAAEKVEDYLNANGFQAATLSGDVPQPKRLRLLKDFQEGQLPILVATDVAARGLHIPDVSHVVNYDLPQDPEDYVHRIGRTARAGAEGDAISLCCETYVYSLPDIQKFIGHKLPIEQTDDSLLARDIQRPKYVERERVQHHPRRTGGSRPGGGHGRSRRRN